MKFVDEYRDPQLAAALLKKIKQDAKSEHVIMDLCGGQIHSIVRYGIDKILPKNVELKHGPGCPVCVTPVEMIDAGIEIARKPDVILTSFGDMLRVPGSVEDLFSVRSSGRDVRVVYSPLESLRIAEENPDKEVVFFAIGFETTALANAAVIKQAYERGVDNFSVMVSQSILPPAMEALLKDESTKPDAFLVPGNVATLMGYSTYEAVAQKYNVPVVTAGFEPLDMLHGVLLLVNLLEKKEYRVVNQYRRAATAEGNTIAQQLISEVFEKSDRNWRAIGDLPKSGYRIREKYSEHNAELKFNISTSPGSEADICISGEILRGLKTPDQCDAFGNECRPDNPVGPTMASKEGACNAFFRYHKHSVK